MNFIYKKRILSSLKPGHFALGWNLFFVVVVVLLANSIVYFHVLFLYFFFNANSRLLPIILSKTERKIFRLQDAFGWWRYLVRIPCCEANSAATQIVCIGRRVLAIRSLSVSSFTVTLFCYLMVLVVVELPFVAQKPPN